MRISPVSILRNADPPQSVLPEIVWSFSKQLMESTRHSWDEYKMRHRPQMVPDHDHWDWTLKRSASYFPTLVGLDYDGQTQGLMLVEHGSVQGRTASMADLPFAYVSYVEAAPWNVKAYAGDDVIFLGVGTALMTIAIQISKNNGWAGRVALHSLPSAHRFYLSQGFTFIGYDEEEELDYFELQGEGPRNL